MFSDGPVGGWIETEAGLGAAFCRKRKMKMKQAMMTMHGMAENRFTSVYFFTNVFLGEIFFYPLNF